MRRRGRIDLECRVVSVESQGAGPRIDRAREGGLHDPVAQCIEMLDPLGAFGLTAMVEVVAVDDDHRIVHPVRVQDQPMLPWKLGEHDRFVQPLDAVQLRLVHIDDPIEARRCPWRIAARAHTRWACRRWRQCDRSCGATRM